MLKYKLYNKLQIGDINECRQPLASLRLLKLCAFIFMKCCLFFSISTFLVHHLDFQFIYYPRVWVTLNIST